MSASPSAVMRRVLVVACLVACGDVAPAQQTNAAQSSETAPPDAVGAPPSVPQPLEADVISNPAPPAGVPLVAAAPGDARLPATDDQLTQRELLDRLQATEARVRELESKHTASHSTLQALRERWDKVQDPSITTVDEQTHKAAGEKKPSEKKWYDRLSIRGYAQFRWNETLNLEPGSAPAQYDGDRSIGEDQNFLIRRARLILSGDVSDHMYVYLQPDFASTPNGATDQIYFGQIRDWYGDLYIDENKVNRVRIGQSKVPYGWENMQSSSNRLALDRSDALNSAVRNERDLGVFYYWTPEPAQDFFKEVLDLGLKGSGNYGVFGLGIYNGQGGSLAEQNDDFHVVSRFTLPVRFASGQLAEFGVQGYVGRYTVLSSQLRPLGVGGLITPFNTLENGGRSGVADERVAGTFVWYPQPVGFQAEWNVGRGPALNAAQNSVEERALYGGYLQSMIKVDTRCYGTLFPFVRWTHFQGGLKADRNAPFARIDEVEFGTEWQFNPQMELTTSFLLADRTNSTTFTNPGQVSYQQFDGSVLRFQFQINY